MSGCGNSDVNEQKCKHYSWQEDEAAQTGKQAGKQAGKQPGKQPGKLMPQKAGKNINPQKAKVQKNRASPASSITGV